MGGHRGQGEGSIYQRKDGRWTAALSVGGGRRQTFYGKTRREVAARLNDALNRQGQGLPAGESRQRLRPYLEAWLTATETTVRPMTWRNDAARVHNHIVPALGHIAVSELTPEDLEAFMRRKLADGLSPQTVLHLRGILRRALQRAVRHGLVVRNVAQLAEAPELVRTRRPDFYDPHEARAFLRASEGDRLEALWVLLMTSGLRRGEALGLTWADVDLEMGTYRVSRALQRAHGRLETTEVKTKASRRAGDLSALAVVALQHHRERQETSGLRPLPVAYVFTSTAGTPLEPRNVNRAFDALLNRTGLRRIRLHDLRHSFGSLLLASGASPREVMELLGHSNIAMTMDVYAHVIPALKRQAMERFDAMLGGRV
jgi:integrase